MKSNPLAYLTYVLVEIVWLTPFLIASAGLAFSQHENGVEGQFDSRLQAANLFLLTAVAARVISLSFKFAAPVGMPAIDTVALFLALIAAAAFQLSGRLAGDGGLEVRRQILFLLTALTAVILSIALVSVAWVIIGELNVRERVLSLVGGSSHPAASKNIVEVQNLSRPPKLKTVEPVPEPPEIVSEYPDVVPDALLPASDERMDIAVTLRTNNSVSARAAAPGAGEDDPLDGLVTITALSSTESSAMFFGRQPGSQAVVAGQPVVVTGSPGQLIARWTKARFAFEVEVDWNGETAGTGAAGGNGASDFLRHIIQGTVATARTKIN